LKKKKKNWGPWPQPKFGIFFFFFQKILMFALGAKITPDLRTTRQVSLSLSPPPIFFFFETLSRNRNIISLKKITEFDHNYFSDRRMQPSSLLCLCLSLSPLPLSLSHLARFSLSLTLSLSSSSSVCERLPLPRVWDISYILYILILCIWICSVWCMYMCCFGTAHGHRYTDTSYRLISTVIL